MLAAVEPVVAVGSPSSRPSERFREKPISSGRPSASRTSSRRTSSDVLIHRLPEPDARVEADPLLRDPGVDGEPQPLLEEGCDLGGDVLIARIDLHRARIAGHVHQAEVCLGLGDGADEVGIGPERGDVVDQLGSEGERPPRDGRLRGVDRDGTPASPSRTGTIRRSSSSRATPSEPGRVDSPPTSTIDAPSATIRCAEAIGVVGPVVDAPVRERVGGDVDDAHHRRAAEALLGRRARAHRGEVCAKRPATGPRRAPRPVRVRAPRRAAPASGACPCTRSAPVLRPRAGR